MAAMPPARPNHSSPPLNGLVLAGGRGTRLGADKGALDYHGQPQVRWALGLLKPICPKAFVSVRAAQARDPAYRDLPLILDDGPEAAGPAAGLKAALQRCPGAAWLVVAADMPLLDAALLGRLIAARDPTGLATAFRHADGTPEPLCAIFEPPVAAALDAKGASDRVSLRRILAAGPAKLLTLDDDEPLTSVNTPEDDTRVRRRLAAADP